jgi:hypothetical protein
MLALNRSLLNSEYILMKVLEVEVKVNLRPTVSRPVCPGVRHPSGTCDQFFFRHEISCRELRLSYFVAPSLTRGRVCNFLLKLLLGLGVEVTLLTTDNQSASPSWCQAPIWDPRPIFLSPSVLLLDGCSLVFCSVLSSESKGSVILELELEFLRLTVSQPVRLGIGPPFGTLDQILSCSSFSSDNYFILCLKAPSLTRKRVCSLQCNHSLVRSLTPNHTLPSHLRLFPFCRLLRLAGTTVDVF